MPRAETDDRYVVRVNLRLGSDVRRFCEIHANEQDNVYVFQPRKGGSVKVSYHESGRRHLKIGNSPAMFAMHTTRPEWVYAEEKLWSDSFEKFASLLPYEGARADFVHEIELPDLEEDRPTFAQVSIGRFFDPEGWTRDQVTQATLDQKTLLVPISTSQLQLCIRVLRLSREE